MSDTQKHPQPRARGRLAPTTVKPSVLSNKIRVLELEAEVVEIQTELDKAQNTIDGQRNTIQGDRKQISKISEDLRLVTQGRDAAIKELQTLRESVKRGGEVTVRYEQEQRKHLNDADDQLKIVATLLGISPIPAKGQSVDDWGSDLRDAYDKAMRQDAETLYARDAYAAQLAEAKTRLERLSAMTLFARLRWAIMGGTP